MKDAWWIVLLAVAFSVGLFSLINSLGTMTHKCPGLVLQTPDGWVCTNVQRIKND